MHIIYINVAEQSITIQITAAFGGVSCATIIMMIIIIVIIIMIQ